MAPIKFEDHLREKLQERELAPGKDAWQKLSDSLGEEPRDQSRKYWLYGIAASLLLALFLGRGLFTQQQQEQDPAIVQETVTDQLPESDVPSNTIITAEDQVVEEEVPATQVANTIPKEAAKKPPVKSKTITEEAIAINTSEAIEEPAVDSEIADPFTEAKITEVVDAVLAIQDNNNQVTPEEIDALLAQANREIANQRLLKQASGSIDAMALLSDVESELERSFRDKVFDALGKGFNEVRTAVVERNN